jgi:hypothetical protein
LIFSLGGGADDSLTVLFSFAVALNSPETVLGVLVASIPRELRMGDQNFGGQKGSKKMSISGSV